MAIGFESKNGESGEEPLVQVDVETASQELELIDIKGSTYKGKMLISWLFLEAIWEKNGPCWENL